jgi:putative selenate reductase molybdopterin-binding subunit
VAVETSTAVSGQGRWSSQVIDKVTGRGRYPADEPVASCHFATLVRSPHAHADVVVDTSAAARVHGVLVAADRVQMGLDQRVRQVGDVVAGVVAATPEAADEAARAIDVRYAVVPGVTDPRTAGTSGVTVDDRFPDNVVQTVTREHGDVDAALAACAHRLTAEYSSGRPVHYNLARRCCVATVDHAGSIRLRTSVDAPYFARHELAAELGVNEERVVVEVSQSATSSFGGRTSINSLFEPFAVRLARLCAGTPVQLTFSPSEEIAVSHSRHAVGFRLDAGCDADGRLRALDIRVLVDHGAFPSFVTNVVLSNCRDRPLDLISVDNYRFAGSAVLTNNPTAGEMRGIGVTQAMWALGMHLDELARRAGLDPEEFLRRNLARDPGSQPSVRGSARSSVTACLDRARAAARTNPPADHPEGPTCRHGWGFAAGLHTSGLGTFHGGDQSTAELELRADGAIELRVAAPDSGQGSSPAYRAVAAEVLAVPVESILVAAISTSGSPYDRWGSVASRGVFVIAPAVADAARRLRERIVATAADRWAVDPALVRVAAGAAHAPDGRTAAFVDLAQDAPDPVVATSTHSVTTNPVTYGVCLAEVCVDPGTGATRLLRAISAYDVGHVIDDVQCRGQLVGAVAMGWEHAFGSELAVAGGRPITADPYDFRFARAADLPHVEALLVGSPEPDSAIGARGIGTPAIVSVAPAICNAVRSAVGVRLRRLPASAEDIVRGSAGPR